MFVIVMVALEFEPGRTGIYESYHLNKGSILRIVLLFRTKVGLIFE